ncbi:sulfatase [candidate division KSB1 bacterium]
MKRRNFLRTAGVGLGATAINETTLLAQSGSKAGSGSKANPKRNILLLVSDDHGFEMGCYGNKLAKTPNLDALAGEGVRFTHAFASVASCSASRSVIYSGLFNHTNGQFGHQHGPADQSTHSWVKGLPLLLSQRGYRTGIVGKYHVQPESVYPFDQVLPGGRNVTAMAQQAKKFIANDRSRPFFLLMGYQDPHRAGEGGSFANERDYPGISKDVFKPEDIPVPFFLPDHDGTRKELAEYYQSVSRLDQGIGQVIDALKDAGVYDDTLIIYMSDNGIPFPGAKTTIYDPGINLPFIVRSPEQSRRGISNGTMTSWVDVVPTCLDWAGADPPPYRLPGQSVLPSLEHENLDDPDAVFGSHTFHEITMYYPMRMIRTRDHKLILNLAHGLPYPFASDLFASLTWQGILKSGNKMIGERTVEDYVHRPRWELYDLKKDPHESVNVANNPAYAGVLNNLKTRLKKWQEETDDAWLVKYQYE